jgi:hypothetical protein
MCSGVKLGGCPNLDIFALDNVTAFEAKLAEAYLDLFNKLEIFKIEFFLLIIGDV